MTPRSFWATLIKILGIYIILEALAAIPQFIGTITIFATQGGNSGLWEILYLVLVIAVYASLLWYCIFKTDWIIDKLKLDQGFEDERFEFNIHRSTILKIIVMVTGGVLLVDSFPLFCKDLFNYFQLTDQYQTLYKYPDTGYIIIYFLQTFIGYFMLTCSRMIVNFIELKRKKPVIITDNNFENTEE